MDKVMKKSLAAGAVAVGAAMVEVAAAAAGAVAVGGSVVGATEPQAASSTRTIKNRAQGSRTAPIRRCFHVIAR